MELRDLPVFFLDLQTTGANPKSGEILEMAWALKNSPIQCYVIQQASGFIPFRIQAITGITNQDLFEAHPLKEVRQKLIEQIGPDRVGVIHYSKFEIPFLKTLFPEGIPFPIICTHEIAKKLYPNLPTRSLKGFAGFFGHQKEELKRSMGHVEATSIIWLGLIEELNKIGVKTYDELQTWLVFKEIKKKSGFEYPLSKEKRLSLTRGPGVYRMLNKKGEVLYVGKATSLHSRVNSYFRGQRGRDPRQLEMLTQVWDLDVTECRSPLEAALLETDEIKKWNPPYNVNLKIGNRGIVFFSRDFSSFSPFQDEVHKVGPFSSPLVLDSIKRLSRSLKTGEYDENLFFDPIPARLLQEGFQIFCERNQVLTSKIQSTRSLIALGIQLSRKDKDSAHMKIDTEGAPEDGSLNKSGVENIGEGEDFTEDFGAEEAQENFILTVDEIADKFKRHITRAAKAYLKARTMTKLLNCDVEYTPTVHDSETPYKLSFHCGKASDSSIEKKKSEMPWKGLTVEDYDRMSILYSELVKVRSKEIW